MIETDVHTVLDTREPASGRRRRPGAGAAHAAPAFAQQIAVFYPYPAAPERAPGATASAASSERLRPVAPQPGAGLARRRHARDD